MMAEAFLSLGKCFHYLPGKEKENVVSSLFKLPFVGFFCLVMHLCLENHCSIKSYFDLKIFL